MKRTLTAAVTALAIAVGLSAPASADDAGYLADLSSYGFQIHDTATAIKVGRGICRALQIGPADLVAAVLANEAKITRMDADLLVLASEENLCPWTQGSARQKVQAV